MTAGRPRFAAVAVLALLASSSAASSRIGPTARASGAPGASATRTRVPLWKIVYTRADGRLGVWMSNQRRLFALEGVPADPGSIGNWPAAWSPDGKDIAFARAKGQTGIYVVRVGHGRPRRLFTTDQEAYGVALAWSPDGRTLAFSVDCVDDPSVTGCRGVTALYTIHRDGTGLRQLTSVPAQALSIPQIWGDAWSPDGRRIAYIVTYTSTGNAPGDALYTISAAGGRPRLIARETPDRALAAPSWAPNGRLIAYGACHITRLGSHALCDLVVRPSSGGKPRVLLRGFVETGLWRAAWTPDSRTLLRGQGLALYAINVQSGRRRTVLRHFAAAIAVAGDGRTFAFIPDAAAPSPSLATLSGRVIDKGPRIPFYSGVGPTNGGPGTASLWID